MANNWLHNGMLRVNGEKMSKSLGNFLTVRDMLARGALGRRGVPRCCCCGRITARRSISPSPGCDEAKAELDDDYAMLARAVPPPELADVQRRDGGLGAGAAARRPQHRRWR